MKSWIDTVKRKALINFENKVLNNDKYMMKLASQCIRNLKIENVTRDNSDKMLDSIYEYIYPKIKNELLNIYTQMDDYLLYELNGGLPFIFKSVVNDFGKSKIEEILIHDVDDYESSFIGKDRFERFCDYIRYDYSHDYKQMQLIDGIVKLTVNKLIEDNDKEDKIIDEFIYDFADDILSTIVNILGGVRGYELY